jgi:predicted metalloendopeptidase
VVDLPAEDRLPGQVARLGRAEIGDDYFANVRAAGKFNYRYDIAKIGKPTDRTNGA